MKNTKPFPNGPLRGWDGRRVLISYPFPLADALCHLRLPKDLTVDEATRIKDMLDSLVTERP